jgi:hypothetical protein
MFAPHEGQAGFKSTEIKRARRDRTQDGTKHLSRSNKKFGIFAYIRDYLELLISCALVIEEAKGRPSR